MFIKKAGILILIVLFISHNVFAASPPSDTQAPTTPTALTATVVTETSIALSWTGSTDNVSVKGYYIYRDGSKIATLSNTSYTNTGLSPNKAYSYTVKAYDPSYNVSLASNVLNVTTLPDITAPTTPTGLAESAVTGTTATISWTGSTDNVGVSGYQILKDSVKIATTANKFYSIKGLMPTTAYHFSVKAYDAANNLSLESTPISITTADDLQPPTTPTDFSVSTVSATSVFLTWTASGDDCGVKGYELYRDGVKIKNTSNTNYTCTGLIPGTSYSFTIKAYDIVNKYSIESAPVNVTTISDTQNPTQPVGLTSIDTSAMSVSFSWNAASDDVLVKGYEIYRNGTKVTTTSSTKYTDNALIPGTTYSYTIKAYDLVGHFSDESDPLTVTTLADMENPTTPTGLLTSMVTGTSIALSWSPSTDDVMVKGYEVYKNGVKIATTSNTSYSNSGLIPGVTYTYFIKSYDEVGKTSSNSNSLDVATVSDNQPPSAPQDLATTSISATSIALSWTASTDNFGVKGYEVYRNGVKIGTCSGTSYNNTGLQVGTTYHYSVKAYDLGNQYSLESTPIDVKTIEDVQPPTIPTGVCVKSRTATATSITWSPSTDDTGIKGYEIYRDGVKVASTSATNYTNSGLIPGNTYIFTIKAYDLVNKYSDASDPMAVTTVGDTQNPTAPILSVSTVSGTFVVLVWTSSTDDTGVKGYMIYRNGVKIASTCSSTYTNTGLIPGTTYSYVVKAYDIVNKLSNDSNSLVASTQADCAPPTTPSDVTVVNFSGTTSALSWSPSTDDTGVNGYQVYRDGVKVGDISKPNFTDAGLIPGSTYAYVVKAYDLVSNFSAESIPCNITTTPDLEAPTKPLNLSTISISGISVSLKWDESTDDTLVKGYEIYRDGVKIGTSLVATYKDLSLNTGSTYLYSIRAYDVVNKFSEFSENLPVTTIADMQPPTTPDGISTSFVSGTSVGLKWNASTDDIGVKGYEVFRNGVKVKVTGFLNYTDTGLVPGTLYQYTLWTYDFSGKYSVLSSAFSVTTSPDLQCPTTPANLSVISIGGTSVTLGWTPATDDIAVKGYEIYKDGVKMGITSGKTYIQTSLIPGITYTFKVRAYDYVNQMSDFSNTVSATTIADLQDPTVPQDLMYANLTGTSLTLSWTPSTDDIGVKAYDIYRNGIKIGTTTGITYTNTGLVPGTTYSYSIRALDLVNKSSAGSEPILVSTVADVSPPSAPSELEAVSVTGNSITLSWNPSIDDIVVKGYEIYRNGIKIGNISTTSYTNTGLIPGTLYTYSVKAYDLVSKYSDTSNIIQVKSLDDLQNPTAPADLSVSSSNEVSVSLNWTASTDDVGVKGYEIYRDGVKVGTTSNKTFINAGLMPGTQYTYMIKSFDVVNKYSTESNSVSASTLADTQCPTAPTDIQPSSVTATTATIAWTASRDDSAVKRYDIYKDGLKVATSTGTSCILTGLIQATSYIIQVKAIDLVDNESEFGNSVNMTTDISPAPATNLKVSTKSESTVTLSWTASKDNAIVKGYAVYRDGVKVGTITGTSYKDTGLLQNTSYTYTIKAFDSQGHDSDESVPLVVTTYLLVSEDTTWTSENGPYVLNGGLMVSQTGNLQVLSGAVIKVKPGESIVINGMMSILGTQDSKVIISSTKDKDFGGTGILNAQDYWETISIGSTGELTCDSVRIVYGNKLINVQGTLNLINSEVGNANSSGITVTTTGQFNGSNTQIFNCCHVELCKGITVQGIVNLFDSQITNCPGTGVSIDSTGEFNASNVKISNCDKGIDDQGMLNLVVSEISNCNYGIYFNTTNNNNIILNSFIKNNTYGVYNNKAAEITIDASSNYWGSSNGPSVLNQTTGNWEGEGDRVGTGIIFNQWLESPAI